MPYKDIEKRRAMQLRRYHERQDWLRSKKVKCNRCPEDDPVCLDFHHKDRSTKEANLTKALRENWTYERMQIEIDKCEILCSNCHRKEHYSRLRS